MTTGDRTPANDAVGKAGKRRVWSAPRERIIISVIHWGVVMLVAVFIFVLALRGDLDKASVTALYGGILGHAATAASHKLSSRAGDSVD